MGKFPDTNLAESLQRVTGVSIDRQRGEGSQVTVRGFGPEYNLVTLNGRQMPTHNGVNRSFDFGDLASEGISAVVVHKTGNATAPTGGVGSLINIITTKPLEAGSIKTFGAKAAMDTSTVIGDDVTPEFSGLYSETFADDTLGIALSFSAQERNNAVNRSNTSGWHTKAGDAGGGWGSIEAKDAVNRPTDAADNFSIPQNLAYNLSEYSTERVNGQLAFQWRPVESITATLDYTYSEFDLERSYHDLSAWFNLNNNIQSATFEDGPIASPLVYSEQHKKQDDFAMGIGQDGSTNENKSLGLNLEWNVSDTLKLSLDYHDSSAEKATNSPYGTNALVTIASFNRVVSTAYFDQDLPILELDLGTGADGKPRPLYKNDMIITGSVFGNEASLMEIEQTRLSGTYDFSDVTSIDFGVELTEVSNRTVSKNVQRDTWGGISDPGYISDILVRTSMADSFDQISGGNDPRRQAESFTASLPDLAKKAGELPFSSTQVVGDCGTPYCASTDWNVDKRTTEETTVAYAQITHVTDLDGMPMNVRLGLRYEETDVVSAAMTPDYAGVYWEGGNEYTFELGPNALFEDYKGDYNLFLPNLDIDLDITDTLKARASVSKTVTRPSYNDIKGGTTIDGTSFKFRNATAAQGDAALLPIESENFDFSVEWYYGDADYLSVGYYQKTVDNFIGNSYTTRELFGLTDPTRGGIYEETATSLGVDIAESTTIGDEMKTLDPNPFDADGRFYATSENGALQFLVTAPINEKTAEVDGVEINWQHNFGTSGFGFIANATIANADVSFDPLSLSTQFVLDGLSDSANLIGFYDKDGINVRVAYNWRDDFIGGIGQDEGSKDINPQQIASYGQLDLSASYEINDNLTVFMDAINVTESTFKVFSREEHQILQSGQTGARYNLGIRYTF